MSAPKKVAQRIASALRRFQPIVGSAKARDCNESDTVMIVTDMLSEMFGYDKYSEVTSEHAIRGTYCDLALRVEGRLKVLVEVKAIGTEFRDSHVKQAVDYAANQGVDWVVLTNAAQWRLYKVTFGRPIDFHQVVELDMLELSSRGASDLDVLYLLSREGVAKDALDEYLTYHQATSRHLIAALVLDDSVVNCIRRELRRITPDVKVDAAEIREKLMAEVLKRETLEGEEAEQAARVVAKCRKQALRRTRTSASTDPAEQACEIATAGDELGAAPDGDPDENPPSGPSAGSPGG